MTNIIARFFQVVKRRLPRRRLSLDQALDRSLTHGYGSVEWRGVW